MLRSDVLREGVETEEILFEEVYKDLDMIIKSYPSSIMIPEAKVSFLSLTVMRPRDL